MHGYGIYKFIMPNRQYQFICTRTQTSYPDDDCKSDQNMPVIYNMLQHILHMCICWFHYMSLNSCILLTGKDLL